ncbi:MAG: sugar phosphate isomerase/epimerase [Vicinamibacteria bacterium]|nr:sugar phosphate isomerase/epimerase [Vicinamibacteria bacterium]
MTGTRPFVVVLVLAAVAAVAAEAAAGRGAQEQTMRDRIGVFLRSTGREEPAEALAAVKAVGLDLIQISRLPERFYTPEGAQEFDRMMKAAGVRAASVVVVFDGESYRDLDAVETTVGFRPAHLLDARLAYARKCVDFAAALGVKVVTFHMGVLPKDPADPTYRRMLDAVTSIAGYAAAKGTSISLETGQETGDELVRFLDAIPVARVGVNFDIANFVLYGMDHPPDALRRLLDRVTSVHVKDGLPPDAPRTLGREVRLGDGRGEVAACLEILRAAGFTGPLVIENYVARASGADPLDELRRARAFIEKTLGER